jgi:hypothetical protein
VDLMTKPSKPSKPRLGLGPAAPASSTTAGFGGGYTGEDNGSGRFHTERDSGLSSAGGPPRTRVLVGRHDFEPLPASASGQPGYLIEDSRRPAHETVLSAFEPEPGVEDIRPVLPAVASQLHEGRQ